MTTSFPRNDFSVPGFDFRHWLVWTALMLLIVLGGGILAVSFYGTSHGTVLAGVVLAFAAFLILRSHDRQQRAAGEPTLGEALNEIVAAQMDKLR